LERLAEKDFFQNNRKLYVLSLWPLSPLLLRVGRFMNNLERVDLSECDVTFENLAHLFRPCPKIVKLNLKLLPLKKWKMNEDLKNKIRLGFQKLRYIVLQSYIDNNSWPVLQEILT